VPKRAVPFKNVIPLEEIIADVLGVGVASKRVAEMYEQMTNSPHPLFGQRGGRQSTGELCTEFQILLDLTQEQITLISTPAIAQAIIRVREGKVKLEGGYDGVFGKIEIFSQTEREKLLLKPKQKVLF
jgi:DNA helicase-2/ATP-dependent DNA helicase PcrA